MRALILSLFLIVNSNSIFSQNANQNILDEIKVKAKETHSDAVIIIKDGKTIYEDYFEKENKPIYIASAGKSLVNLAIGKLIDTKQLNSLDQPVYTLFPEWKQGKKKDVTIRMLLNHTSGIQNYQNAGIELEPAPNYKVKNIIDLALSAELSSVPGEKFDYNNKAVALLGGIVEKASGKRFDYFFVDEFYKPMGIANYNWVQDDDGNPTTHGAFYIKASDLVKFGELLLNKGIYNNQRIISESWIEESFKAGQKFDPRFGLLWWRKPAFEKRIIDDEIWKTWKDANIDKAFLKKMKPLKNKLYENKNDLFSDLKIIFGDDWSNTLNDNLGKDLKSSKRIYSNEIVAYYADGYRGNYLVIIPQKNIVAVRCADHEGFNYQTDFFRDFVELIMQLSESQ
ncbi:serine hydrolase [Polaribacter batillariae]|uniref:Serine hydrolase n=1 Tax=Polaribacter batillariae TaxID=2808900 RepID=A0ABX7SZ56_9FLAO|nr:serine hydrolase [Polaribacter batillariae]QTD38084.1 serine hydrolase [Polaribacter batillariae]